MLEEVESWRTEEDTLLLRGTGGEGERERERDGERWLKYYTGEDGMIQNYCTTCRFVLHAYNNSPFS